ncbi:MAG: single-stranded DNA-binding protein [Chloroflexi bacterium]|nr:single-stranded DNA-binding protein [Chloroflexota bacterium]
MSRGLNKVMLIGRLGRDPEMRYTPSGRAVTTFSVATSRSWNTANGDRRTETEWFRVVAWGNLAEICNQLLHKGQQVYIEGRLKNYRWQDENGVQHIRTEIVANEMIILGDRRHLRAEHHDEPEDESEGMPPLEEGHADEEHTPPEDDFPF